MTPPKPAPFVSDDCPAFAFDDRLSVPSAAARVGAAPGPAPAARATPARRDEPATLFDERS